MISNVCPSHQCVSLYQNYTFTFQYVANFSFEVFKTYDLIQCTFIFRYVRMVSWHSIDHIDPVPFRSQIPRNSQHLQRVFPLLPICPILMRETAKETSIIKFITLPVSVIIQTWRKLFAGFWILVATILQVYTWLWWSHGTTWWSMGEMYPMWVFFTPIIISLSHLKDAFWCLLIRRL